jgi:hypothetical protein
MSDNTKAMYKVSYLMTGSNLTFFKVFKTFQESMDFSKTVATGDILEIKRLEDAS